MKNSQLIKENKIAGGYTKVYPLAYIQGIYDSRTGEELIKFLKSINHIYLPYNGTSKETRESLPSDYRRKGIIITYKVDDELITEVYIGSDKDVNDDALFTADVNWEIVPDLEFVQNNASKIPNGAIIPEHLSPALWELLSKNHTITNFPDEEDLTQHCKVLKFKDRNTSAGKGYKILRKNWVGSINILEATEVSLADTIYEIRYDFDLNGQEITLPKNATLLFNGGTFNNGKVICYNTNLLGINKFEDAGKAEFSGTFLKGLILNIEDTIKWYNGNEWVSIRSGNDGNDGSGGGNNGGGNLPDSISAVASAHESDIVEADADVNPDTGVFTFNFGIPRGRDGKDGKDGKDGVDGITPVAYKSIMVFKTHVPSMSKPEPDKPVGGSWNPISGNIVYPDGWGPTDNIEKPVWMSTGEFSSASPNSPTWSKPICISGEDGSNGTDGTTREYVYQLTKYNYEPPQPAGSEIPSPNENGYVPTQYGWTASPTGISEEMRAEWVLTRKKKDDGSWGYWEGPVLWSNWGVNGQDGDGVEYIYKVGGLGGFENPTPKYSNGTFNIYAEGYQDDEYHAKEQGWTDNPTGVSISNPCEWVCVRKQKNGVWQAFSDPALWAKYGENGYDGTSIRTKYTVTENSSVKPKIDYPNSKDPGSRWTYAVPSYSGNEALWSIWTYMDRKGELISFTVNEDGKDKVISGWQGPCIMSGSQGDPGNPVNYKTTVFALSTSRPEKPTSDDPLNPGTSKNMTGETVTWVDYPNQTPSDNLQWWQCTGVVDGLTERIMTDSEGKLMWGEVLNVHGKDGVAQDGKMYEFRFKAYSKQILGNVNEILPDNQRTVREPLGWFLASNMPQIDAENPFMWEIVGLINPDGTLSGRWSDPFCVTGERGPKGETGPAGPVGPEGPQGISGIPGKHIEAWYCLGTDTEYDAKYDNEVAYDIDPSEHGWLGYCPKPTNEKPFIWCIQGSVIYVRTNDENNPFNKILEGFNGKQGKWSEPFKTNAVSIKGVGIETVREYYLVTERSQGVTLNPNDSDINNWVLNKIPAFTPKKIYLWNYEVIVYEDGRTGNPTAPAILTRQGADGKGILSITEKYAAWDDPNNYPHPTSDVWKSAGEAKVSESKPYLWNWEHIEYTEGEPDDFFNVIGAMGAPGPAGRAGQIIYPAGVYSPKTTYVTTDKKAPYVYDTQYKQYYVLNYIGRWTGHSDDPNSPETGQNRTPGEDFEINKGKYWLKFESFDAIFANIGIIANGLIGSSVFNGEYMFSQQGIDKAGSPSTNYENFCDSYPESYNGTRDPYNTNNSFRPNWCVNFATGEQWVGAGKIHFSNDGSGILANGTIKWDSDGNVLADFYDNAPQLNDTVYSVNLPKIIAGYNKIIRVPICSISRTAIQNKLVAENSSTKFKLVDEKGKTYTGTGSITHQQTSTGYGYYDCFGFVDEENDSYWYVKEVISGQNPGGGDSSGGGSSSGGSTNIEFVRTTPEEPTPGVLYVFI